MDTQLSNEVEDDISWRWTENAEYTTKSAYKINDANLEGQNRTKM
jgi:hypothetical protein